jgi:formate dehydrogenase major subunit
MFRLTINGTRFECPAGTLLLQALQTAGASVPHLCHDDRLKPYGGCRLCLVEIDGEARPVASCAAEVRDGMVIRTETPALLALRKTNLGLLATHYPAEALVNEPQHPLHQWFAEYGVSPCRSGFSPTAAFPAQSSDCLGLKPDLQKPGFRDESHPYLGVDMSRCIHCNRCVRICDEVQGQNVWAVWGRGETTHVAPANGNTLIQAGCVSCGACVDSCPSGALYDKRSPQSVEKWTRSTCVYCGVGCQMQVGSAAGKVVQIRPADSPVNRGHLCVKGRYAFEFNHAPDRITTPMLRDGDHWRPVSWDEALDFTAGRLKQIVAEYGADAAGVLGSARATNEENYLAQKFARLVLGTHNVDCCARVCHQPSAKALKTMLGTGAATNAFDDIEIAQTIMICGCNPTENHPIVGARIKQAVRNGARLIVVDPRRTELCDYADIHLPVRPGHNVQLFNALAATIIEEGLVDREFIAARVDDFDAYARFIRDYAPENVAEACGVPAADIRAAARLYAQAKPAMCFHGLGMTEHLQGTEGVMTLINLALLTGNLGKPGSGINPLRGQNNVQGSAHMGCEPATLAGSQSFAEAARFEATWGQPLPASPGKDLLQMLDAALAGQFKALWAFGYDIYLTLANMQQTGQALQQLQLLIVQDLFLNETAKAYGHVFLPAASVFERDGTFMNSDRRVQRVRQAVPPPGDAKPDGWIIQQLAARMGHPQGFEFNSAEAIWNEVRQVWPGGAGLSYARLEHESINWPCPSRRSPRHAGIAPAAFCPRSTHRPADDPVHRQWRTM